MLSTALKEVKGIFDGRFLLTFFFPAFAFCGFLVLVWESAGQPLAEAARRWQALELGAQVLNLIAFLTAVALLAVLLSARVSQLHRLYEGYWEFPGGRALADRLRRRHRRRLERLADDAARDPEASSYEEIYLYYPPPTRPKEAMPTLLGNILKNAELYPQVRYHLDAVLLWPRLFHVLPKPFLQVLGSARASLDLMLVVATLALLTAPACAVCLALAGAWTLWGGPPALWWWTVAVSLGLAWLAYRGAVGSALTYAEQVKAAFDLYRNQLLRQLGLRPPATLDEEARLWPEVCRFLYRNAPERPDDWVYVPPSPDGSAGGRAHPAAETEAAGEEAHERAIDGG